MEKQNSKGGGELKAIPFSDRELFDRRIGILAVAYPHSSTRGLRHPVCPSVDISSMALDIGTTLHYLSAVLRGERHPTLSFTRSLGELAAVGSLENADQLIRLCRVFGPRMVRQRERDRESGKRLRGKAQVKAQGNRAVMNADNAADRASNHS